MLKIGDFSKLSRISIRMLRHYDEIGLLSPVSVDEMTNYRYYGEYQLEDANRISVLKDMGVTLAVIKEVLQCDNSEQHIAKLIQDKISESEEQRKQAEHRIKLLEGAIEKLRKGESIMKYNVVLKKTPERYVASVRQIIPDYSKEGMLWEVLMKKTQSQPLQLTTPVYAAAVYHDKEYKEQDIDVEIQEEVKGTYENTEHVIFKTIPPIQIASVTYKGSYSQMNEVNMAIANWIKENGYEFAGPMFNIYYASPATTQNEDEFVTEVCYPIK